MALKKILSALKTELKFIENYLDLQKLRIPQKSNITTNIEIGYPDKKYKIAPMLLIPFIENAWKYGVSMDKPSNINLNINAREHQLIMIVENSVYSGINAEKGSGLGISNVTQRLQMCTRACTSFPSKTTGIHSGLNFQ